MPVIQRFLRSEYTRSLIAVIAGALQPLAFAPFNLYPLAVLSLVPLFFLWRQGSPRRAAWYGLLFGMGLFGVGVTWVYVAIHTFGHTPVALAALLTLLFVLVLSLFPALAGYLARRVTLRLNLSETVQLLLWFPIVWTVIEWFRGWFLTGFPWLSLGYSQIDSPLRGYAPLIGMYGLTLLCSISAGLVLWLWRQRGVALAWGGFALLGIWSGGMALVPIHWTEPVDGPLRVTLIQGNVPQSTKWDPAAVQMRLDRYAYLTSENLDDSDLIVWPENSITVYYHQLADGYFAELSSLLQQKGTDLILGVPLLDDDGERYYTTLMSLGSHHGFYRKRHLVPFGEYLPFEPLLRGLINFFDMPMSSFSPGPEKQPLLQAAGERIAASVCYEDAFAAEMRDFLPQATLLVNGSNNAWYGDSLAPHQHLQISRMRALEFGRPMLRATTNGISAIIESDGKLEETSEQFKVDVIRARVQPMKGETPYNRFGNFTILIVMFALVGAMILFNRRQKH